MRMKTITFQARWVIAMSEQRWRLHSWSTRLALSRRLLTNLLATISGCLCVTRPGVPGRDGNRDLPGHGVLGLDTPMAQIPCSSEAPSSAALGDSCVWGGRLSCSFWEYLHPSFILAFIVDIPRTVKRDGCAISRTTVSLPPLLEIQFHLWHRPVPVLGPGGGAAERALGWGAPAAGARYSPSTGCGRTRHRGLWGPGTARPSWLCHAKPGPGSLCCPARGQHRPRASVTVAPGLPSPTSVSLPVTWGDPLLCVTRGCSTNVAPCPLLWVAPPPHAPSAPARCGEGCSLSAVLGPVLGPGCGRPPPAAPVWAGPGRGTAADVGPGVGPQGTLSPSSPRPSSQPCRVHSRDQTAPVGSSRPECGAQAAGSTGCVAAGTWLWPPRL